jgi:anti-anti-sigma factor
MSQVEPLACEADQTRVTSERFECRFHCEGRGAAWVSASGELDFGSAPQFEQTVNEALEHALLVIIDLRTLTFIDSTGLHAITDADTRARQNEQRLVLIRGSDQVGLLIDLVGLTGRLKILDLTPVARPSSHHHQPSDKLTSKAGLTRASLSVVVSSPADGTAGCAQRHED